MADVAMYEAKRLGLRHARYDERSDPHGRDRLEMIGDLRDAIDSWAFHLHYQPVVEVSTGRVAAVEALIRWRHPVRGDLDPAVFIPLAEQAGLIPQITRVVVDLAAAQVAELRSAGHDLSVSVNVSAKDLVDEGLADHVVRCLERHGVPVSCMVLEITETALTDDPARSRRTLDALRSAGVRIAIDDFGVGYSSLTKLLELPVDEIKLDRSFVTPIDHDRRAQAIVRSTVELALTLGLTVVAEGIETEGALRFVTDHGVDRVQGYLIQVPLDGGALATYLAEHPIALAPAGERLPAEFRPTGRVRP